MDYNRFPIVQLVYQTIVYGHSRLDWEPGPLVGIMTIGTLDENPTTKVIFVVKTLPEFPL